MRVLRWAGKGRTLTAAIGLIALLVRPAWAATIVVDAAGDDFGLGGAPNCTLREAILAANRDEPIDGCAAGEASPILDRIEIPLGVYVLGLAGRDENDGESGDLDLVGNVELVADGRVFVDGAHLDRVFDLHGDSFISIDGLIIENGDPGSGDGGAIRVASGVVANVVDSTVRFNTTTGEGGGVANRGALTLARSRIYSNTTSGGAGAGLFQDGADATIEESAIFANFANPGITSIVDGGGIASYASTLILENVTISGNRAAHDGGGLYLFGGDAEINNSTIAYNKADQPSDSEGAGGGIFAASGSFLLGNSIVAFNTGWNDADCSGGLTSNGYNLIGALPVGCLIDGTATGNLIGVLPDLGSLALGLGPTETHRLLAGSRGIDEANPGTPGPGVPCALNDQRNIVRPQDGDQTGDAICDMGAAEVLPGELFTDGFESRDTSSWSAATP